MTALENFNSKSMGFSEIVGFLDFYLNPQKYYCPFVKDTSSLENIIEASQDLTELPRCLEDFTAVSNEYIIPKDLLYGMENASTYHSSLKTLDEMKRENHLISHQKISQADKSEIERLVSASMNEYMLGVYKWQWGYDEDLIKAMNSSLDEFRTRVSSASGLEKVSLELWIAYLEFLLKRDNSLSDEDKLVLKNISLKGTETLAKSISTRDTAPLRPVLQRYEEAKSEYLKHFLEFCENGSTQKVIDAINIGIDVNVKDTGGDTALMRAARYGYTAIVNALLNAGADVNFESSRGSALMFAAEYGHIEIVNALLKVGAEVNAKDYYGETALMKAALHGHTEVADSLIKAGAKVKSWSKGDTALREAAEKGHTEIVKALLKAGADVNAKDNIGMTALMLAARYGHTEVAEVLLKHGAAVNAKDKYDETAFLYAKHHGYTETANLLRKYGAKGFFSLLFFLIGSFNHSQYGTK